MAMAISEIYAAIMAIFKDSPYLNRLIEPNGLTRIRKLFMFSSKHMRDIYFTYKGGN
jgi:hypothetical protein